MIKKWKVNPELTKSFTYLLPVFDIELRLKFLGNLSGSYLYNNAEELMFSILYKFSGKEGFTKWEDVLTSHSLFAGHEDYGEHVLYKFNTTDELNEAVKLFEEGKYSEYSLKHKEAVVSFLRRSGVSNYETVEKVLRKDEELREQMEADLNCIIPKGNELSSPPNLGEEVFSNYVDEIIINNNDAFEGVTIKTKINDKIK